MKCKSNMLKQVSTMLIVAAMFCLTAFSVLADERLAVEKNEEGRIVLQKEDMQAGVYLYTYTLYDKGGNPAGTIELRYGKDTSSRGRRLWITMDGSTIELENENQYFSIGSNQLTVSEKSWSSFFGAASDYTYTVTSKELPSIPAPASVSWDSSKKPGVINWATVSQADGRYMLRLTNDGESVVSIHTSNGNGENDLANHINKSGSYMVQVKAIGDKTTGDSEWTYSKAYEYQCPEEILGTTDKIWWTVKSGETIPTVINWNPVPGAGGYQVELKPESDGTTYYNNIYNTMVTSKDWTDTIKRVNTERGPQSYTCTVRALAGNIEVVANAPKNAVATSEKNTTADAVDKIGDALEEADASTVLEIVEAQGVDSVANAMQSDKAVLDTVSGLEAAYAEENQIKVEEPKVDEALPIKGEISVVGAGINAVSGSSIGLSFSKLPKSEEQPVNEKLYKNAVQVDISIENRKDNQPVQVGALKCPIAITMPVPQGIDLDKLVILHYHADGTYEYIYPAKNADGTITFSVTSFSTFVFAEIVVYEGSDTGNTGNSGNSGNTGNNSGNTDSSWDEDDSDDESYTPSVSTSASSGKTAGIRIVDGIAKLVKANGQYAVNEWAKQAGSWYFAGADGALKTGWYQDGNGTWYLLQSDCKMATGWQMVDGKWYYLDAVNGDMKTGWLQDTDGKWYFLNAGGDMKYGWLRTADGKWYYLGADGACLMNTTTPDGYPVDANGAWIQ